MNQNKRQSIIEWNSATRFLIKSILKYETKRWRNYLLTQATRAASWGVSRSRIEQRISSGRTRRSPRASILRSLWMWVWACWESIKSKMELRFCFRFQSVASSILRRMNEYIHSWHLNRVFLFLSAFCPCEKFPLFLRHLPSHRQKWFDSSCTKLIVKYFIVISLIRKEKK